MSVTFQQLGLHPDLLKAIEELGFIRPTPIQVDAIPLIKEGRDLIASSQTGTGKTAAFLLPILHRLLSKPKGRLKVLILEPTRELASQVEEQMDGLAKFTDIRVAAVFGGVGMGYQEKAFRSGVEVIAATPGRLLDHMSKGNVNLGHLEFLVLDEADRMLDMGFLPDVRQIIRKIPKKLQSVLFSATMPYEIETLALELMHEPAMVRIAPRIEPAVGITHAIYPVSEHLKAHLLMRLLREHPMSSVLVFTRTKMRADRLTQRLSRAGFPVMVMHGDRSQRERQMALEAFKRGECQILVATDVAARGLDIEKISHVINYDVPATAEDYLHRVGRTARAGAVGDAFTLVAPLEEIDMWEFEQKFGMRLPRVLLPDFEYDTAPPVFREHGKEQKNQRTGKTWERKTMQKKYYDSAKSYKSNSRQDSNQLTTASGAKIGTEKKRYNSPDSRSQEQGYSQGQNRSQGQDNSQRQGRIQGQSNNQENRYNWNRQNKPAGLTAARTEKERKAPVMLTPAATGHKKAHAKRDDALTYASNPAKRRRFNEEL